MAQNYTRQSIFADGDTITAALFNDEYNQLFNTFKYSSTDSAATGHRHDGTAGEGGNIYRIGDLDFLNKIEADSANNRWGVFVEVGGSAVEQVRIQDGAVVPVTNNDVDLGSASFQFKDLYIDGTANIDSLVADTADINGGTLDGVTIGGSSAGAGSFTTLTASGDVNFDSGTLFVDASADAVGIGTTSFNAANKLEVTGDINTTWASGASRFIGMRFGDGSLYEMGLLVKESPELQVYAKHAAGAPITFLTGATPDERMRIDSSGNVGIGVTPFSAGGNGGKLMIGDPTSDTGAGLTIGATTTGDIQFGDATTGTGRYAGILRYQHADDVMAFWTASAEKMRIDSSGNVGIGTSSPSALGLQVTKGTGVAAGVLFSNAANNWQIETGTTTNYLAFTDNQFAERMRIDSSGNVGIGTSSPSASSLLQAKNTAQSTKYIAYDIGNSNVAAGNGGGFAIYELGSSVFNLTYDRDGTGETKYSANTHVFQNLAKTTEYGRFDTSGQLSVTSSGGLLENAVGVFLLPSGELRVKDSTEDGTAQISIYNNNTTNDSEQFFVANNVANVDIGNKRGALKLFANGSEAMRIDSSGNLLVGITGLSSGMPNTTGMYVEANQGNIKLRAGGGNTVMQFAHSGAVSVVGSITVTASATTYNTSSDARLKENIADAEDASSLVDAIKVRQFDWKTDGSHQRYGMVAQELLEVAPEAVYQPDDPEEMMGVDYSKLVPMLVKEIQSLRARLAQLKQS